MATCILQAISNAFFKTLMTDRRAGRQEEALKRAYNCVMMHDDTSAFIGALRLWIACPSMIPFLRVFSGLNVIEVFRMFGNRHVEALFRTLDLELLIILIRALMILIPSAFLPTLLPFGRA